MNFLKKDVVDFYRLRCILNRKVSHDISTEIFEKLVSLRQLALNTDTTRENFVTHCYEVWKLLAQLPTSSKYYLPPPYINDSIETITHEIFCVLFVLERKGKLPPGNNLVLNGIKGVGKTTLLVAIGSIISCLLDTVLPIFWNFEKDSTVEVSHVSPYVNYLLTLQLFQGKFDTSIFEENSTLRYDSIVYNYLTMNQLNDFLFEAEYLTLILKHKPVYLFDEFTLLYLNNGIHLISRLREIARTGTCYLILTASCFNVKKYIYPHHSLGSTSIYYPDLNCSLFVVKEIRPLRDPNNIISYYKDRYGEELNSAKAREIYLHTGGVGRLIDMYHEVDIYPELQENIPGLFNCPQALIVFGILTTSSVLNVQNLLNYASRDQYDHWIDELILYENEDNIMEFLIPTLRERIRCHLQDNQELFQAFVFKCQRLGFKDGSTGHSNEDLLMKYLHNYEELELNQGSVFIQFHTNNHGELTSIKINGYEDANQLDILQLHSQKLVKWTLNGKETGIDRIWWRYDEEGVIRLFGLQLKTGKDTMHFTAGSLSNQRSSVNASQCNDKVIAGIIIKAEIGFSLLLPVISNYFQLPVEVCGLYILTNKQASEAFSNFWDQEEDEIRREQRIEKKDLPPRQEIHRVSPSRSSDSFKNFPCYLIDGTSWLVNVLPSSLIL
jgi:hypothetical protein